MKNSSALYDSDISNSSSDDDYNKFRQDIGNRYNNSEYGIIDFILPEGWFASKTPNGENSLIVDMHPGTQNEYMEKLISSAPNDQVIPTMELKVDSKKDLLSTQELLKGIASYDTTNCNQIQSNSTSIIDGKTFNASTQQCITIDKPTQFGEPGSESSFTIPGFNSTSVFKKYEYDSAVKIYTVTLTMSIESYGEKTENKTIESELNINKFSPIIDSAIKTLRIK